MPLLRASALLLLGLALLLPPAAAQGDPQGPLPASQRGECERRLGCDPPGAADCDAPSVDVLAPYFAGAVRACYQDDRCTLVREDAIAEDASAASRKACCEDALCAPLDACDITVDLAPGETPAAESCAVVRGEYCTTDELLAATVVCHNDDECKSMVSTGVRTVELPLCCYNAACVGLHDCAVKEETRKAQFLLEDHALLRAQCEAAVPRVAGAPLPAGEADCRVGGSLYLASKLVDNEKPRQSLGLDAEGMLEGGSDSGMYLPVRRYDEPDTRRCEEIKIDHRDGAAAAAVLLVLCSCACFQFCMCCTSCRARVPFIVFDKDIRRLDRKRAERQELGVGHLNEDINYLESFVKFLNVFTALAGFWMCFVGGLLLHAAVQIGYDGMPPEKWTTTIYSVLMGMLVVASSIRLKLVLRQFRFMSKMFGRGLLYIFVGSYYLNVVSGGFELAITTFLLDPLSIEGALPLVAGGLIFLSGVVFVLIHVCWCYEGCLEDGSEDIEADLEDMTDTPLKRRAKWLDYLLRLVTVCIGGFLCRCSVDIYLEHFDGCVGVDPEATCHAKLNRYSLIYLFDAIYAGCFGFTIIIAGLEWKIFLRWFGFLSRPIYKSIYFFFIAIYFLGAGNSSPKVVWPWEGGYEPLDNLPVLGAMLLIFLACTLLCVFFCFLFPILCTALKCCLEESEEEAAGEEAEEGERARLRQSVIDESVDMEAEAGDTPEPRVSSV